MRNVILYMQTTLNGHAIGEDEEDMDWLTVTDQTWELVNGLQERCDTALIGRVSYQDFTTFWPGAVNDDSLPPGMQSHARWLTDTEKVVFSTTTNTSDWQRTRFASDLVDEVKQLKSGAGKDLLLLGGIGLANSFAANDLIDEYWVLLNPGTTAGGQPLFSTKLSLRLIEAKPFDSGVVALHYGRT